MIRAIVLIFTWFAASVSGVSAADKLKVAIGQREIWHGSPASLGPRAGIFQKHGLELEYTEGAGQTMQPVISGNIDIGVSIGTYGAFGAYAKGAPIRIIGAESTGEDAYWYVRADSAVKSMADMDGRTISFSTVGASTHSHVLGLIDKYKVNAKPVATGGFRRHLPRRCRGRSMPAGRLPLMPWKRCAGERPASLCAPPSLRW